MPQFYTNDYYMEVARGNIPGHSAIEIAGENTDIDSGAVFEDIWDGGAVYVPPTQARLHNIVSTLAADTGTVLSSGTATGGSKTTLNDSGADFSTDTVAVGDAVLNDSNVEIGAVTTVAAETLTVVGGMRDPDSGMIGKGNSKGDSYRIVTNDSTGASLVWMIGLNASFLPQQEFVVLNGVGAVASAGSYSRMHLARSFGPGTSDTAGNISATAQTDATVTWLILNGNNQTLMAIYTVPVNLTGYIVQWWSSMSKAVASAASHVHLRAGTLGPALRYSVQPRAINTTGSASLNYPYRVPKIVPGGSDIWVEANSNANDVGVSAGFEIILVAPGA